MRTVHTWRKLHKYMDVNHPFIYIYKYILFWKSTIYNIRKTVVTSYIYVWMLILAYKYNEKDIPDTWENVLILGK